MRARTQLVGEPAPAELLYLRGWLYELARTRRYDMNGACGFDYPMIESWARLTHRAPEAWEVEFLFAGDLALRFPDGPTKGAD